jgi:integrase/recombinase XerD
MSTELNDLFEQFIRERKYLHNLTEGTLAHYREVYRFFTDVGFDGSKKSLQESIIKFRERGTSVGAINTYARGLNVFLKWLHKEHGWDDLSLQKLRVEKRIFRSLTDEQLKTIISYKPKSFSQLRVWTLTMVALDTGARVNELLTLERKKVDFDNLLITVIGKGNKERMIPFSYELRKVFWKFMRSHSFELVFGTRQGALANYDNLLRDFYVMERKLGIKTDGAFHSLRRTFATNYIRHGGNPLVLQRLLGHSTLTQTSAYVKLVTDDLQVEQHRTSLLNRLR